MENMTKKMDVCIYTYITESLCCTAETNAALYINYTSIKKINELNMLTIIQTLSHYIKNKGNKCSKFIT